MVVLRCPHCGEEIRQDESFCSHCGKQIDKPVIDEYATYHQDLGGFMVKSIGVFVLLFIYFVVFATYFNQMGLWFCLLGTIALTILTYLLLKKIF